jgi:hypothetical protein
MTGETLQKAIRNQPFRPFVIRMADGRSIPVTHPELIAYKTGSRTAIVVYDDSFEFIDPLLATGVKFRELEEAHTAEDDQGGE